MFEKKLFQINDIDMKMFTNMSILHTNCIS